MMLAALTSRSLRAVKAANIINTYVTAPVTEKIWIVLGPEFGSDTGKKAVIVHALYGPEGRALVIPFIGTWLTVMENMGCESYLADPGLWHKPMVRPEYRLDHYSNILCYVDGTLCVHHDPMPDLMNLDNVLS